MTTEKNMLSVFPFRHIWLILLTVMEKDTRKPNISCCCFCGFSYEGSHRWICKTWWHSRDLWFLVDEMLQNWSCKIIQIDKFLCTRFKFVRWQQLYCGFVLPFGCCTRALKVVCWSQGVERGSKYRQIGTVCRKLLLKGRVAEQSQR